MGNYGNCGPIFNSFDRLSAAASSEAKIDQNFGVVAVSIIERCHHSLPQLMNKKEGLVTLLAT